MSTYYALEPADGNYLQPEDFLKITIQNFKHYFLDEETAKKEVAERIQMLKDFNAGQELIDLYENSNPIKCTVYNDEKSASVSFDLNNNQGILILPDCEAVKADGLEFAVNLLAEQSGYVLSEVEE